MNRRGRRDAVAPAALGLSSIDEVPDRVGYRSADAAVAISISASGGGPRGAAAQTGERAKDELGRPISIYVAWIVELERNDVALGTGHGPSGLSAAQVSFMGTDPQLLGIRATVEVARGRRLSTQPMARVAVLGDLEAPVDVRRGVRDRVPLPCRR